jgi:hypothetical protein
MLVLPLDCSRPLLVLGEATDQFKDRAAGVVATDRETGAPLAEVNVVLTVDGSAPQMLRLSVPRPGLPERLGPGVFVKVTGLTFVTGRRTGGRGRSSAPPR